MLEHATRTTTSPSPRSAAGIVRRPRSTTSSRFSATNARMSPGSSAIVVEDEPGAQRQQRQLAALLRARQLVQAQRAGQLIELGGHGLEGDTRRARDLVIGCGRQPLAVAEQRRAQAAQDALLLLGE